jgi:hypothetical protein
VNEELLKFELCCKNKNKNKKSSHWNKTWCPMYRQSL